MFSSLGPFCTGGLLWHQWLDDAEREVLDELIIGHCLVALPKKRVPIREMFDMTSLFILVDTFTTVQHDAFAFHFSIDTGRSAPGTSSSSPIVLKKSRTMIGHVGLLCVFVQHLLPLLLLRSHGLCRLQSSAWHGHLQCPTGHGHFNHLQGTDMFEWFFESISLIPMLGGGGGRWCKLVATNVMRTCPETTSFVPRCPFAMLISRLCRSVAFSSDQGQEEDLKDLHLVTVDVAGACDCWVGSGWKFRTRCRVGVGKLMNSGSSTRGVSDGRLMNSKVQWICPVLPAALASSSRVASNGPSTETFFGDKNIFGDELFKIFVDAHRVKIRGFCTTLGQTGDP